jgi:hypothetical protein
MNMQPNRLIVNCMAAMLFSWQFSAIAATNLIANPSFESGSSGWTFSGGGAGTCPSPCTFPHTGDAAGYKNLFDGGMGTISQAVATTPSLTYAISLWLADNSFEAGTVTASFGSILGVTATGADTSPDYRQYTFTAMASGLSTDFVFAGIVTSGTFFIDDVSVSVVPEPSRIALILVGLAPLWLWTPRRRDR